jgi:pheromone shutdown-related protein TraB
MAIKLVGTSHIAKKSVAEVRKVITQLEPDIVGVELDINRFHSLMGTKERKINFKDIVKFGGFGFVFAMVGQWIQKKLGDRVGVVPGADMKAAILTARNVKAQIWLVDQPINITLYKLSKEVSIWEKLRLVLYLIFSPLDKTNRQMMKKINLDDVPPDNLIDKLISELKDKFPNIYRVLVDDRNKYIANAVNKIQKKYPEKDIVVVVGAGHLKGIKKLISKNIF